MSQRAHNLLNCVNVKAPADFYECCKNQRPVLLCTIPMLFHQLSSSQKQNKVMKSDTKCQFQVSKVEFVYQNIQTFPWFQVFWGQEDPKHMFDWAEFKYHFFFGLGIKKKSVFSPSRFPFLVFGYPTTSLISCRHRRSRTKLIHSRTFWLGKMQGAL